MKMFYKIFISCIFLWIGNICHAQKGLAIAPLFSGKYDKDEQAIVYRYSIVFPSRTVLTM